MSNKKHVTEEKDMRYGIQNCMAEWSFFSGKRYQDPFNEGEIDPYKHPLTAHTNAGRDSREELENDVPIAMSLTQTGHQSTSLAKMLESVRRTRMKTPRIPVIKSRK